MADHEVNRKHLILFGVIAAALSLLHCLIFSTQIGSSLEILPQKLWYHIRGALPPPDDVLVVLIDEESFSRLQASPLDVWPRNLHAELIELLRTKGAEKVVFDLVFHGESQNPRADAALAEALASMPSVIGTDVSLIANADESSRLLKASAMFTERAGALAHMNNIVAAGDGAIHEFGDARWREKTSLPSLAQAAVSGRPMPAGLPSRGALINYYGPPGTITSLPYYRLLDNPDSLPDNLFKDKIAFVGSGVTLGGHSMNRDYFRTTWGGAPSFGVEIHATKAANLIQGTWIRRSPAWHERLWLALALCLSGFLIMLLRPLWATALSVSLAAIWGVLSYQLFLKNFFLPGISAILLLPLLILANLLYYYLTVYRAQRRVRHAFAHYLTPQLVDRLAEKPEELRLGGESREVTMLFTDIADFTPWMEQCDPHRASELLNHYFTTIGAVVLEAQGTLVKFIGDGMFVIWGAPVHVAAASDLALSSAVRIQAAISTLSALGRFPPLATRIGIHRGSAIVGNFGSEKRFDYTALGDSVNLCSRLEQLNKLLGTSILISEDVKQHLQNNHDLLALGPVKVAGRKQPVRVYTPLLTSISQVDRRSWDLALGYFSRREWTDAVRLFEECSHLPVLSAPATRYLRLVAKHRELQLESSWQGELQLDSKQTQ